MPEVLLRVLLTPAVVLVAGLVQQRYGHRIGGRVVGLPLKAGPFLVVLLLTEGADVATAAAQGTVAGLLSVVLFCVTYGRLAPVLGRAWRTLPVALLAAMLGPLALSHVPQTWVRLLVVVAAVVIVLSTWPAPVLSGPPRDNPRWDLPVRALVAGVLVFVLTTLTPVLGPTLAGILAGAPVVLTVVAPATHHTYGPLAAAALLRGTLRTIPATATFITVVSYALIPLGGFLAFTLGLLALAGVDTAARLLTRTRRADPTPAVADL